MESGPKEDSMLRSSWIKTALVSLALTSVPVAYAFADAPAAGSDKEEKLAKHFPMKAAQFEKRVEHRIGKARERLDARLAELSFPQERQKAVHADFDAAAERIRAAAREVEKDGTVTLEEARQMRELAKAERKAITKKYHLGKGKKKKA